MERISRGQDPIKHKPTQLPKKNAKQVGVCPTTLFYSRGFKEPNFQIYFSCHAKVSDPRVIATETLMSWGQRTSRHAFCGNCCKSSGLNRKQWLISRKVLWQCDLKCIRVSGGQLSLGSYFSGGAGNGRPADGRGQLAIEQRQVLSPGLNPSRHSPRRDFRAGHLLRQLHLLPVQSVLPNLYRIDRSCKVC